MAGKIRTRNKMSNTTTDSKARKAGKNAAHNSKWFYPFGRSTKSAGNTNAHPKAKDCWAPPRPQPDFTSSFSAPPRLFSTSASHTSLTTASGVTTSTPPMDNSNNAQLAALRSALDMKEWGIVKRELSRIPTSPPLKASSRQLAASLDLTRAVADALAEACSFTTAFETAFATRRALHGANVCNWAVEALKGFTIFAPVVARVSTVLGLLGMGVEGRGVVGCIGAVDELAKLWKRHSDRTEIVSTLVSLCSGHIDNVSRVMRQRGLVTAMGVLKDPAATSNPELVEQTLILVGLCAICTPDNKKEARELVPVLTDILERLNAESLPDIARHALSALGNIGDCWVKESNGYEVAQPKRLTAAIVNTWKTNNKSRNVASAASWALSALLASRSESKTSILEQLEPLTGIIAESKHHSTTIRCLHDVINCRERGQPIVTQRLERDPRQHSVATPKAHNAARHATISPAKRKRERPKTRNSAKAALRRQNPSPIPVVDLCSDSDEQIESPTAVRDMVGMEKRTPKRPRKLPFRYSTAVSIA